MSPLELPGAGDPYTILSADDVARIRQVRGRYPEPGSAVLPALWILQETEGILTAEGMAEVARALEIPPGPVEAVASFYSMFFFRPHGKYVVEVCTNLACLLGGCKAIVARFEEQLEVRLGQTSADGVATLMEVECIGACDGAPAIQVNHGFKERMTVGEVDRLVASMRAGTLDVHALRTGADAAGAQQLVDLRNPGANRVSPSPNLPPVGGKSEK